MSSSATAVDQLLCPEFSFSLDQLLTTSLMQQQQQQPHEQMMQQQQQQQPALRLPTGTCAAAAVAASAAEATIAVDSWDAVAYMNDLDSEPRTCSLVPQLGGEVNFNVGGGGVLGSPVVNAAAAATFNNCGGINNSNNFNLSFDFGGFEIVNPEVHQLGDNNNHEEVEDEDDEDDDDDESESTSAASPEVRQAKRQARQLQQLNQHQQQQEDFEPSQFTQELLNMSVRDMHQFLKKSNFTKEQVIQLKAERRRMKNRTYAKTARCKRKNRQGALESTVQQAQREQQELKGEVTSLRGELSLYKRKVAKAEQILRSHGLPIPW